MKQITGKKQIGMYTLLTDEEGTLQIQAPTLLKPLLLDPRQAHDLASWLAEQYTISMAADTPVAAPVQATSAPSAPPQTPIQEQDPQAVAHNAINQTVKVAQDRYPDMLDPANRDRLIEQVRRMPEIKALLSQSKITPKQITLWVEQRIEKGR